MASFKPYFSSGCGSRGDALRKVACGKFVAKAGSDLIAARPTRIEPTTFGLYLALLDARG